MPCSGWPLTKAELDPYYERAQKACKLGPYKYDFGFWEDALGQLEYQKLPLGDQIINYVWQIIPPTHLRFGQAYKSEIEQAKNINTYLHANVVDIETNDPTQVVTRLRIASLAGKKFWVRAKAFILAGGGIENPRLLLASNKVQGAGLGNQYDLVGRFFMKHPYLISGKVRLAKAAPMYAQKNLQVGETSMGTALGLSKAVQEREQILNFSARLLPVQEEWLAAFNRLRFRNQQVKEHKAFPTIYEGHKYKSQAPIMEDLGQVIANLNRVSAKAYTKLFNKNSFSCEKFKFCDTHLIAEQAPNPDSRITLSCDRDSLGLHRAQLDWRLTAIDKYTIARSQQIIAEELERSGLGQLQIELTDADTSWQSVTGSYHHMGTTRMSTNPRLGVVNEQYQIHEISNLYVAGSSVFPTSGLSNPTLTIIALTIRLADHLKVHLGFSNQVTKALKTTPI